MEILKDTITPIVIFHGGLDFFCNVKISQKIKEMNLSNVSVYIYPDSIIVVPMLNMKKNMKILFLDSLNNNTFYVLR